MNPLRLLGLSAALVLLGAGTALSDGGFVSRLHRDVREPEQTAVIHLGGKFETLLLRVKYDGAAGDFAWVVPVPSVPDVQAVSWDAAAPGRSLLMELSDYTSDREGQRAVRNRRGEIATTTLDVNAPPGLVSGVRVLERKQAGVYDVAVLTAGDPAPLVEWLRENGFAFPADRADVLDHYVRSGWTFVAMRIAPGELHGEAAADLSTGEIQPILLRFRSDRMVYPLRMSSINAGGTRVLIYTLGASPMVPSEGPRASEIPLSHTLCSYSQLGTGCTDPETGAFESVGPSDLKMTREAMALGDDPLSVGRYTFKYAAEDLTGDLTFETFDPAVYWRGIRDTARSPEQRAMAGWVLSSHDPSLLGELVASDAVEDRCAAAYSPMAGTGLLRRLATDKVPDVRWMVAANPSTPSELIVAFASSDSVLIRQAVARNPSAPIEVVRLLAGDESYWVRTLVGCHPSMNEDIWRLWSRSTDPATRLAAAGHRCAPVAIIEELATDEDVRVRRQISYRQDLSHDLKLRLARDADADVRRAIARSCTAGDEDVLALLAADGDPRVRTVVAWQGHTPPAVRDALARDSNSKVRRTAEARRGPRVVSWPVRVPAVATPGGTLIWLAQDPNERVREAVAGNTDTPLAVLVSLADDPAARVRRSVALNPATPEDTLWKLAGDADVTVSEAALIGLRTPR